MSYTGSPWVLVLSGDGEVELNGISGGARFVGAGKEFELNGISGDALLYLCSLIESPVVHDEFPSASDRFHWLRCNKS